MDYQIAILGSPNAILGFKALGVKTFPVVNLTDAQQAIQKIQQNQYGILLITEDWAEQLEEEIKILSQQTLPAITFIPSQLGSTGFGNKNLKKIVEQAVGSDILSKK